VLVDCALPSSTGAVGAWAAIHSFPLVTVADSVTGPPFRCRGASPAP